MENTLQSTQITSKKTKCVTMRQDALTTQIYQILQYLHLSQYTNLDLTWLSFIHNLINFSIYIGFPEYCIT